MAQLNVNGYRSPQHDVERGRLEQHEATNTYRQLFRAKVRAERKEMCWLALAIISTGCLCYMATWGVRVEPYVVRLDAQGVEHVIRPIPALPSKPEQNIMRDVLTRWIEHTRTISFDPVVFTRSWQWVQDYTTSRGWQQIRPMQEEQLGRQRLGTRVEVQVKEVLPVGGASGSWTITWEERAYNRDLRPILAETLRWRATVRIADFQEAVAKQQLTRMRSDNNFRNVLGIFTDEVAFATPSPME